MQQVQVQIQVRLYNCNTISVLNLWEIYVPDILIRSFYICDL
jgi:hypothetical protein